MLVATIQYGGLLKKIKFCDLLFFKDTVVLVQVALVATPTISIGVFPAQRHGDFAFTPKIHRHHRIDPQLAFLLES